MNMRFSGFGGQGIILSGLIYGQAAVLEGKNAVQTQSYGSESRGGACKSDVIISDDEIYELESAQVDVLVAMSQQACERYISSLKEGGTLIIEKDLVKVPVGDQRREPTDDTGIALHRMVQGIVTDKRTPQPQGSIHAISATDIAFKKFGRKIVANMVVLGHMSAVLDILSPASLKKAIQESVPSGTESLNIDAFEEGYVLGKSELERKPE